MMDVLLDEHGELVVPCRWVSGVDLVKQKIRIRLRTFAGEWILNASQGLPFVEWRSQKLVDLGLIRSAYVDEISGVAGVERVSRAEVRREGRAVTVDADIVLETGEMVAFTAQLSAPDVHCPPHPLVLSQLIWRM